MDAIGIAGTGLTTHQRWMNAISDNLANINTAKSPSGAAFQARYIEAVEDPNGVTTSAPEDGEQPPAGEAPAGEEPAEEQPPLIEETPAGEQR